MEVINRIIGSTDQWSPLNPEGKKQYDRDFLLSLQDQCSSRTKPDNLPDLPDVILDKVSSQTHAEFCPLVRKSVFVSFML